MKFDLVIRNGEVVTETEIVSCDIGIRDGKIIALSQGLSEGRQEIDAKGKVILPGGIDSHCHIDQKTSKGVRTYDNFLSATVSAACGGTTTVIPFACQHRGQHIREVVEDYRARADGQAIIDYAIHLIVTDPTPELLKDDLPTLIDEGYTSLKVYMTYDSLRLDDYQILNLLDVVNREGAMMMVHAEGHDIIRWLTDRLLDAGLTAPKYHALARDALAEREASHRAITLAELVGTPILIVHVSGEGAIAEIQRAQSNGAPIFAETCPQYLFLTAEDLDQPGFEGAKCLCSPPPRDEAGQEAVWRGIQDGTFSVVSSDHSAYKYDDLEGKKAFGSNASFDQIPAGVPGIEVRLPLLFSAGVQGGRIDLHQFAALTSTNHAKMYGLYPKKGVIAIGSDADIVVWDPNRTVTINRDILHDDMDYTPYEGIEVQGWPEYTISRGEIIFANGEPQYQKGRGLFLPCDRLETQQSSEPCGALRAVEVKSRLAEQTV